MILFAGFLLGADTYIIIEKEKKEEKDADMRLSELSGMVFGG